MVSTSIKALISAPLDFLIYYPSSFMLAISPPLSKRTGFLSSSFGYSFCSILENHKNFLHGQKKPLIKWVIAFCTVLISSFATHAKAFPSLCKSKLLRIGVAGNL